MAVHAGRWGCNRAELVYGAWVASGLTAGSMRAGMHGRTTSSPCQPWMYWPSMSSLHACMLLLSPYYVWRGPPSLLVREPVARLGPLHGAAPGASPGTLLLRLQWTAPAERWRGSGRHDGRQQAVGGVLMHASATPVVEWVTASLEGSVQQVVQTSHDLGSRWL